MKLLPLSIILIFLVQHVPDKMPYHKLQWSEYLSEPSPINSYSAVTAYRWTMEISTNYDGWVFASVKCYFLPYCSFTRTNDSATLFHERLHLAIAEIYARQLDKALRASSGCKSCEETVNSMYENAWTKMEKEQNDYDSATAHGQSKYIQAIWSLKISNQLKEVK